MKIGIDAHGVGGHSFGLGNETYSQNLIGNLLDIDGENEYHIFVNHPEAMEESVAGHRNAKLVPLWPHSQWIQRPLSLPFYAWREKLDLVHVPFVRPPFLSAKTVVTVHDADYEVYPQHFSAVERWRMKLLVKPSCQRADMVFTVSEFTRRQIHELYHVPKEKIVVTYNAADHMARRAGDSTLEVRPLDIPPPWIFFIGMIQPKKNLVNLVRAFDLLKSRTDLPHQLVLAGKWGWQNAELEKALAAAKHRAQIHFPGYMNAREIARYLPQADVFVFPSLYESFGIPPLEAQRLGVPVLISDTTCFPEIYENSAQYCDPHSVESIASGLERLLWDRELRDALVRRGQANAKRFSWRKSAEIVLEAYRRLAGGDARDGRVAAPVGVDWHSSGGKE